MASTSNDRFFNSWNMNLLSLGTMRNKRLGGCPVVADKALPKAGRGSLDYKSHQNKLISMLPLEVWHVVLNHKKMSKDIIKI